MPTTRNSGSNISLAEKLHRSDIGLKPIQHLRFIMPMRLWKRGELVVGTSANVEVRRFFHLSYDYICPRLSYHFVAHRHD